MKKQLTVSSSNPLFQKELTEWSTNLSMGWESYGKTLPKFPKMSMKGLNKSISKSPFRKIESSISKTALR